MKKPIYMLITAILISAIIACGAGTPGNDENNEQETAMLNESEMSEQTSQAVSETFTETIDETDSKTKEIMINNKKINLNDGMYAVIKTPKGEILLKLEHEKTPITVANFVGLAEGKLENKAFAKGKPFYDGLKFHRVIADFMIQGGDPDGTGAGGPGYQFDDEIVPELKHNGPGILSMANAGPGTNGSQFFITHKETPWLDGKHTVFGNVVEGKDVLNKIQQNDVMEKVTIVRVGKSAENFNSVQVFTEKEKVMREKKAAAEKKAQEELKGLLSKATKTSSGLAYIIHKKGTGENAKNGQNVTCHYVLKLTDGKVVDSSRDRNQPFSFVLGQGQVIPGWEEGLKLLNPGTNATLIIPPDLAYGAAGAGGVIPPNATLIFEIELISAK
jgi:peptidyl-prolyl cis-trans isomerase A (cyclophilin A)